MGKRAQRAVHRPGPRTGRPRFPPPGPRGHFGATVRPMRRFRVPIRTLWGQTARFGQSNHRPTRPRPRRAPPSAGRPRGAFSCCAKSACTALSAGRDPAGRNRPIGYFSPPKTTPKPPGTTIFGPRLLRHMRCVHRSSFIVS